MLAWSLVTPSLTTSFETCADAEPAESSPASSRKPFRSIMALPRFIPVALAYPMHVPIGKRGCSHFAIRRCKWASQTEDGMPKGLLLMMTDIDPVDEEDFNRWYEEEHLDERMAIPGFINARRFTALEGGPKYLALYDLESPEVLQSAPYRHIVGAGKSAWTQRMEKQFINFRRNVYVGLTERKR